MVHGDDAHVLGDTEAQQRCEAIMRERYELKVRAMLGFESGDDKEATFLSQCCDE